MRAHVALRLLTTAFTSLALGSVLGMSTDEWAETMGACRPPVPVKAVSSKRTSSILLAASPAPFDRAATIAAAKLPFAIPSDSVWTQCVSTAQEELYECRMRLADGTAHRFAVYGQYGNLVPYYWNGTGYDRCLCQNEDESVAAATNFVRSVVCAGNDHWELSWSAEVLDRSRVSIRDADRELAIPYERFRLVFVDERPNANWQHPCRYVFLPEDMSEFAVAFCMVPPKISDKSDGARIYLKQAPQKDSDGQFENVKQMVYRNAREMTANAVAGFGDASHSYFVLISGGADPENNSIRFWADTAMFYATLTKKYNVPRDHIRVFISDGTNTSADANLYRPTSPVLVSSPVDLDGDGTVDVDGPAKQSAIRAAFSSLAESLTVSDRLLVFITSHGGPIGTEGVSNWDSKAYLYSATGATYDDEGNKTYFTDAELTDWTKEVNCPVAFAIETCYSGGFIDNLMGSATDTAARTIATACNHYESSWGTIGTGAWGSLGEGQTRAYNCWIGQLIAAFRGNKPKSMDNNNAYPWQDGVAVDADANADGQVCFLEAKDFAYENDETRCTNTAHSVARCVFEHPQFDEYPVGTGSSFHLVDRMSSGEPPRNDDMANATVISGQSGSVTGTNVDATSQTGEPLLTSYSSATKTVWWKWTAPTSGSVTIDTVGSTFDTQMGIYTGSSLTLLTLVKKDDDSGANLTSACTFNCTAGTSYYVCVGGYQGSSGTISLNWSLTAAPDLTVATTNTSWPSAIFLSKSGETTSCTSFEEGESVAISVGVGNIGGGATTRTFATRLSILDANGATAYTFVCTNSTAVSAGTMAFSIDHATWNAFSRLTAGSYVFRVMVDCYGEISESNENNNAASVSFTVTEAFRPVAASVSLAANATSGSSASFAVSSATWKFDKSAIPLWVTSVVLAYGNGNRASFGPGSGTTTLTFSGTAYFIVNTTANVGSARNWTWTLKDASGRSACTLSVTQAAVQTYTVTYKPGAYGTGEQQTAVKTNGVALVLKGEIFSRTNYVQTGWATSDGGSQAYALGATYTANAAITLYPVWSAEQALLPDLAFAVFSKWATHGLSLFACPRGTETPTRLFEKGAHFSVVHGFANVGEGVAYGPMKNLILICDEDDMIKASGVAEFTSNYVPYSGSSSTQSSTAWTNLAAGVYAVYACLDYADKVEESNESNNEASYLFAIRDAVPLAAALDASGLTFTTSGTDVWYGTKGYGSDGIDCAATLHRGNATTNDLNTTVTGPGTLSFKWKVSSERNYDTLQFLVDGVVRQRISGTGASWTNCQVTVGAGSHRLTWRYAKDGSFYAGMDCGWVDQVTWTPTPQTYTVTYKPGACGTGAQQTAVKTNGVELVLKGEIFSRTNYVQTGWATSDGGSQAYALGATYTANAAITLYPVWTADAEPLPDFGFVVFSNWASHGLSVFACPRGTETPTRLFEKGARFSLVHGFANVGDGMAYGPLENLVRILDANGTVVFADTMEFEGDYEPYTGSSGTQTSTMWTNFTAGVYSVRVNLDCMNDVEESNESNNEASYLFAIRDAVPLATALDASGLTFTTSGTNVWYGTKGYGSDGIDCAATLHRGDATTNDLNTTVTGPGTLSFKWKVSSERNYDTLQFLVDGVVRQRISGTGASWTNCQVTVGAGSHRMTWRYAKDRSLYAGMDCGWVDQVTWTPTPQTYTVTYKPGACGTGAQQTAVKTNGVALVLKGEIFSRTNYVQTGWATSDGGSRAYALGATYTANAAVTLYPVWTECREPLPPLSDDATPAEVAAALQGAADAGLGRNIGTPTEYNAFRAWAETVRSASGTAAAGLKTVQDSPCAWLSYALGCERLIAAAPKAGDLEVECFEPSAGGTYAFTVSVKDVEVGAEASVENLKKVFGIEGGASLGGLSSANVDLTFGTPADGKVKFTAGPKDASQKTFFMRVKMGL